MLRTIPRNGTSVNVGESVVRARLTWPAERFMETDERNYQRNLFNEVFSYPMSFTYLATNYKSFCSKHFQTYSLALILNQAGLPQWLRVFPNRHFHPLVFVFVPPLCGCLLARKLPIFTLRWAPPNFLFLFFKGVCVCYHAVSYLRFHSFFSPLQHGAQKSPGNVGTWYRNLQLWAREHPQKHTFSPRKPDF